MFPVTKHFNTGFLETEDVLGKQTNENSRSPGEGATSFQREHRKRQGYTTSGRDVRGSLAPFVFYFLGKEIRQGLECSVTEKGMMRAYL